MKGNKIQSAVRLEAEMHAKINFIAKRNRRSLNAQLEFLAQECIEEYEEKHGAIELTDEEIYKL